MGYRLQADEPVPKGLRRIVREEIEDARDYLAGNKEGGPDEAIHEARKSIKKIRALLRLVRDRLGPVYEKENAALRILAASLSEIRDAAAIIETFDQLPGAANFSAARDALELRKQRTDVSKDRDAVIKEARLGLRKLDKRVKTWPLKTSGFAAIEAGLERCYRRGRKAMGTALKKETPECFHEWRKRVKDHWYHTRLIENLWTDEMRAREKSLKDLETWLGDDHNLFVLRELVSGEPAAFGEAGMADALLDAIDKRQKELRENALSLGSRLYDEKPKSFTRRIRKLWNEWQRRPDSLREREVNAGKEERGAERKRLPASIASRPIGRGRFECNSASTRANSSSGSRMGVSRSGEDRDPLLHRRFHYRARAARRRGLCVHIAGLRAGCNRFRPVAVRKDRHEHCSGRGSPEIRPPDFADSRR